MWLTGGPDTNGCPADPAGGRDDGVSSRAHVCLSTSGIRAQGCKMVGRSELQRVTNKKRGVGGKGTWQDWGRSVFSRISSSE